MVIVFAVKKWWYRSLSNSVITCLRVDYDEYGR